MIEDPPRLLIRREFPRPADAQLAALAGAMTGHLIDALGGRGALDHRIKPLAGGATTFAGTALPCHNGPADNLALFAAVAVARPGDVIVAATDECEATSLTGDLLAGMARNRGIAAIVTDGLVRDVAGILALGPAVFCRGVSPNSPARNGPGTVGLPVVVGGVSVSPGDVVVGDADGAVVVPLDQIDAVIARLAQIRVLEADLERKVKDGLGIPGFIEAVLNSPATRYLD